MIAGTDSAAPDPATLAEALATPMLDQLVLLLAPPDALRAQAPFELEIESADEGTFTLSVVDRVVTAKKGFAKKPLLSATIPKGGFALIRRELRAACAGFPDAPMLAQGLAAIKAPAVGELDALMRALARLPDVCFRFDIQGCGVFALARGPVDEAAHTVTFKLAVERIDAALAGAPLSSLIAQTSGDRAVLPTVMAALAPLMKRLRV